MKQLSTKHFGAIQYKEDTIITFSEGVPGFPDSKQFIIINETDDIEHYKWLQSIDDEELCFVLLDVYKILPDYNPIVEKDEVQSLGDLDKSSFLIYNIVVIPEDVKEMRVNLKAPIVINPDTRKGKQVILANDEYEVKYKIFNDVDRKKAVK